MEQYLFKVSNKAARAESLEIILVSLLLTLNMFLNIGGVFTVNI